MRLARIVIFAKAPVPGKVKTRLIPALGEVGAAELAHEMLERTLEEALATGLPVELCGDPHPAGWYEGPAVYRTEQGDGDLGRRLAGAARRVLSEGEYPILIGADCPELGRRQMKAAVAALERHDAVLHPATDGGYALLGLTRFDGSLFTGIPWSTDAVAAETRRRVEALHWSLDVRETLRDVDEPEDLLHAASCEQRLASIMTRHGFQLPLE